MRTITNTFNVYNFDELTQDGKKQAIEKWYADGNREIENEQFKEFAEEFLSLLKFKNVKLRYSLGYCQGDGLSFTADTMQSESVISFLEMIVNKQSPEIGYKVLENAVDKLHECITISNIDFELLKEFDFKIEFNESNSRYCHKNSVNIDSYFEDENQHSIEIMDNQRTELEEIENSFKEMYFVICDILENQGYSQIYYEMNETEFNEMCEANSYEFLEDGTLY